MSGNSSLLGLAFWCRRSCRDLQALSLFKNAIGESTTKTGLEARIGSLFFKDCNDEDSIGLAEQLVLGTGVFTGLYNKEPVPSSTNNGTITTTTPEGASVNSSSVLLVIKPELHCLGTDKRIIVGGASGITVPLLLAASLILKLCKLAEQNFTMSRSRASQELQESFVTC
jgi:hypothetical protein